MPDATITDGRMDAARFVKTIEVEQRRSRYFEVYEKDVAYIDAGATAGARAMRAAMQAANWR